MVDRMLPTDPSLAELLCEAEAGIADVEARMRQMVPAYPVGDQVDLHGEVFVVASYQPAGMPGYWLRRGGQADLFLPVDLESFLLPVVH
jgi:hypothetical protein